MAEFLVFTLAAPLGAFGDLAGHERRGSLGWPGRSAVLGLLGAAFGICRDDREGQERLRRWQQAVAVLTVGEDRRGFHMPLRDYHTVQTVASALKRPATRRDALIEGRRKGQLNTVLTSRDYIGDAVFRVALWNGDLDAAVTALRSPAFVPFLGRKSCPLAAPMDPHRVTAEDPVAALCQPDPMAETLSATSGSGPGRRPMPWPPLDWQPSMIASDPWPGLTGRTEMRRDDPIDREAWHFAARRVTIVVREAAE